MSSRWTRIAGRIAGVLLGISFGLGAAELALRIVHAGDADIDLKSLHEVRPDRPWLFGMRPNSEIRGPGDVPYRTNADGFRDRDYPREKAPGTFRIVILGHSTTLGWGVAVEDTFVEQLEARLAQALPGTRVEVINFAVSGYNPYVETQLFLDVGVKYDPDLVLVQFGINDLNDPTLHFASQMIRRLGSLPDAAFPNPDERLPPPPDPPLSLRICQSLRLCEALVGTEVLLPNAALLRATFTTRTEPRPQELAWLRARYQEIADAARAIGARFAVILFPFATQLDGRSPATVQARLSELGREAGWPTIDLLPAFLAASAPGRELFIDLWHPTPAGHVVAADALLLDLRCKGLLPLPPAPGCGAPAAAGARTSPVQDPSP